MKIKTRVETEIEIKTLEVKAKVRYWEDASIDGECDTENGDNIPCKIGSFWCPKVDIDTGVITNWTIGKTARIHYKVCDECSWRILDVDGICIHDVEDEYVPDNLCPIEKGYGDYIIMHIDSNGKIEDWSFDIEDYYK